jgi:hypothetical protein
MEAATATKPGSGASIDPVAERLADIRALAASEPGHARDAAWLWIRELGESRDADGLDRLFALGDTPPELDGPTDGILVMLKIAPGLDQVMGLIAQVQMPWLGKRFDAAGRRGDNRMTGGSRFIAKLLWPRYAMKSTGEGNAAFDFVTRVEPGKQDPATEVLVIDYDPVEANPDHLIRKIRDELVEVVPGAYLGKVLHRGSGDGGEDAYRNLGFFALRPAR